MSEHRQSDYRPEVSEKKHNFLGVGLALLLMVAAFLSGVQLGSGTGQGNQLEAGLFSIFKPAPASSDGVDLTEFWRVWNILDEKFVSTTTTDPVSDEERVRGAIKGLVDSYDDPYTVFLPPQDASQFEDDISGNFSGVGMEVGIRDDMITVIAPLPNTPASESGIVAQDIIVRIDGKSTEGMSIDEAVRAIRGEKGTEVVLTIFREGESELLEIGIVRDTINIPTIDTEEIDDIFVISLYNFNAMSELRMQEALRSYIASGKDKMILDLRGNPGGFLQSAVSIASYFLPVGTPIVRESFGPTDEEEVYRSQGKTLRQYQPKEVVVLIDGGSASAAEILAGALSEHGIATLIGQTTFGKGSVQELVRLPNGSSLKVTIARWLTPNGVSISDGGLSPDVEIRRTPQQIVAGEDPQLDAAVAYLHGQRTFATSTAASSTEGVETEEE